MRNLIPRSVVLLLALAFLSAGAAGQARGGKTKKYKSRRASRTATAQQAKQPAAPEYTPVTEPGQDGVQRIRPAEARKAFDAGKAVIVDVRGEPSYNAGHIKGALLIPLDAVGQRVGELPRDRLIITYCS